MSHLIQVDEIFSACGASSILSSVHNLFPTWNRNPIFVFPVLFSLSFYYLPFTSFVIICSLPDPLNLNYRLTYPLKSSSTGHNPNYSFSAIGEGWGEGFSFYCSRFSAGTVTKAILTREKCTHLFKFYMIWEPSL